MKLKYDANCIQWILPISCRVTSLASCLIYHMNPPQQNNAQQNRVFNFFQRQERYHSVLHLFGSNATFPRELVILRALVTHVCLLPCYYTRLMYRSGARPTNDISIEFEIRQKLLCSGLKPTLPITTELCTRHDSYTVVTCATFRCDRLNTF